MNGFGAQGRATGIRDGQIGSASTRTQRGSSPQDHPSLAIQANTAKSELHRLEEDPARAAERVEDGAGHRNAGEVHERPGELGMQRDR